MFRSQLDRLNGQSFNLGLVLGGGGAKGFAHLGVYKALREKGIEPDIVSGVSAGALAGSFIAAKKNPDAVMDLVEGQNLWQFSRMKWPKHGIFNLEGLKKLIQKEIPFKHLEDLPIPLITGVSNLNSGRMEYLTDGDLAEAVLASSSIPFLFQPVLSNGELFVDGGVLDNLPIRPIRSLCKKVLVVSISPVGHTEQLDNIIQVATRSFQMSVSADITWARDLADIFIEPEGMTDIEIFDFKRGRESFDRGYYTAREMDLESLLVSDH